jgi:hypothetical protein
MKIAFYKGSKGTIVDKLICLWTLGIYSHVELVDDNDISYSSSSRDKGVRLKAIKFDVNKWDIYNIKLDVNVLREFELETRGKKYDWIGIFFYHLLPFKMQNNDKWYCSEWVSRVLQLYGYKTELNVTPSRLYKDLKKLNIIKEVLKNE